MIAGSYCTAAVGPHTGGCPISNRVLDTIISCDRSTSILHEARCESAEPRVSTASRELRNYAVEESLHPPVAQTTTTTTDACQGLLRFTAIRGGYELDRRLQNKKIGLRTAVPRGIRRGFANGLQSDGSQPPVR